MADEESREGDAPDEAEGKAPATGEESAGTSSAPVLERPREERQAATPVGGRAGGGREPAFLVGTEVASARRLRQPGFDRQLSLLEQDYDLRNKLKIALIVIFSVFVAGIVVGAVVGVFV